MPNADGIHERILVEAHMKVEPGIFLYIRSRRLPDGEKIRSYRFKLTNEQAICLSEDIDEELDRYNIRA